MQCGSKNDISAASHARELLALLRKRRKYNREYMRAWRASSQHKERDRANRQRWYYERKLRRALEKVRPHRGPHGERLCGYCGKLARIDEIARLEMCELARSGYVEVRFPYCGQC